MSIYLKEVKTLSQLFIQLPGLMFLLIHFYLNSSKFSSPSSAVLALYILLRSAANSFILGMTFISN